MARYILRRLFQSIPLLLAISVISFGVMQLAPGNFLDTLRGQPTIQPGTIESLKKSFGLDQPWYIQYFRWLGNALQGDFGYSFDKKIGVFSLIQQRVYYTVLLAFWSTFVAWVLAIPLGIYIATHRNGIVDRVANLVSFALVSLPGFFVALLALKFASDSGLFPIGSATTPPSAVSGGYESFSWSGKVLDTTHHMILPVAVLGLRGIAGLMRQMRGNVLEVLSEQYVMAARARGLKESRVIWKHAVRNAINPLITIFGFEIAGLLAGAALVEQVMSWPGLGKLLLDAVQARDIYLAMGSFVVGAVLLIIGNLIADVLLAVTDPRIKFS